MKKLPDSLKAVVWVCIGIAIGIIISGVIYQCTLP